MTRLVLFVVLAVVLPGVLGTEFTVAQDNQAQDKQYEPFDYSKTLRREQHVPPPAPAPEPAPELTPEPEPPPLTHPEPPSEETRIIGQDELDEMLRPRPEPRVDPDRDKDRDRRESDLWEPSQWEPNRREPSQQWEPSQRSERPLMEARTSDGRTQVLVMTGCGWYERDKRTGEFNSSCLHCNVSNTAWEYWEKRWAGRYRVGEDEDADVRIVDITTPEGGKIDLAMGEQGRSFTELIGKTTPGIDQYTSVTPVFVVRSPDRDPVVIEPGWPKDLDPRSTKALWWLSGLFGIKQCDPDTWSAAGVKGDVHMQALALWVRSGPQAQAVGGGWGAKINARDLIELLAPGGRKQIFGDTYMVVPNDFRPRLVWRNGRSLVEFDGAPRIEYKIGFIPGRAVLTHAEVAEDFSRVVLYARGYVSTFPIDIDISWRERDWRASDQRDWSD
jgi:hypothetical protein